MTRMPRRRINRSLLFLVALAPALMSGGCAVFAPTGPAFPPTIQIQPDHSIGQTFLAEWDGLQGVEVFLTPPEAGGEPLQVALLTDLKARRPLWSGEIEIPPDLGPSWITLPFAAQPDSAGLPYYVRFQTDSGDPIELSTAPGGYYIQGALYRDGQPLNRQLDFRLKYHPAYAAIGLLKDGFGSLGILLAFGFLFTLPGWALFSALWERWGDQDGLNKLILASGAGTAVYPILLLWMRLIRLQEGDLFPWIVPFAALLSFGWRFRRGSWRPKVPLRRPDSITVLLWVALLAVLISRLLPLRILPAGMWGDSYQHTLITQLLVERGGLFSSWEPYAPLVTFTYHFGFHSTAAVMEWSLGIGAEKTVLWAGQLLNFLAVAGLVPLSSEALRWLYKEETPVHQRRLASVVVLVFIGLLSPMPMFYTNWGRYTQIAGQALLVVFMVVALDSFRRGKHSWRQDVLNWILLGGLALTHYRVLIYAILWIAAYWMVHLRSAGAITDMLRSVWRIGSGAALLFLPWFLHVFAGGLMEIIKFQLSTPAGAAGEVITAYNQLGDLTRYLPAAIWGVLTLIVIWGLQKHDKTVFVFGLWSLLLLLVANPSWLGLPGAGAINNFAILIAVYIPAGIMLAAGVCWAAELLSRKLNLSDRRLKAVGILAFSLFIVWGGRGQVGLIKPRSHSLVTAPDLEAFQWVKSNTPTESIFLVNTVEAGGGNTLAGTDAGWWLPFYAGRDTTLPPFIYIAEKTNPPNLRLQMLELNTAIRDLGLNDPVVRNLFDEQGVTHIYLGQQQGRVNGKEIRINPSELVDSKFYTLIYHVDRVWVFEIQD